MMKFLPALISVLLFLAALGAYVFLSMQISTFTAVAQAARANAEGSDVQQVFQKNVSAFVTDTQTQQKELAGFVTKDSDVVSLIDVITAAAKRENVAVTIGSVSVDTTDWRYHEPLKVVITAQGSFAALASFASNLESLPVASHLVTMTAESSENHSWFDSFTVDFVKEKPLAQ